MESRILGQYQVSYTNGFIQDKNLIKRSDWEEILKPLKKVISIIEADNKDKENEESMLIKQSLKVMFGDYNNCFAEGNLLHQSMTTGFISLPENQGGNHKVTWKIKNV